MRIAEMNWMQVEAHAARDDRATFPSAPTEQHAYLSLCVDRDPRRARGCRGAAPLQVPVFPVINYG